MVINIRGAGGRLSHRSPINGILVFTHQPNSTASGKARHYTRAELYHFKVIV